MKRLINIFLGATIMVTIASCSDDLPLADLTANTEHGIALRSLVETNGLDLASLSSTYVHQFEIDAVDDGKVPSNIRILVGFTDDDDVNSLDATEFGSMSPDSFTETTTLNTHELPVGTFSTTLGDLVSHLGLTAADYDRGDEIEFEFEMIAEDGTVFNKDNVGSNVAASGAFSFYNSPFEFSAEIDDPSRIVLSSAAIGEFSNSKLIAGDVDSVQLTFDSDTFVTQPTITRTSAGGFTDDVVGALTAHPSLANTFFFLYTAGAAATDQVSFTISGGESTAGFPMETVTKSIFTIDNIVPTIKLGGTGSRLTDETGGEIKAITVSVIFSEELTGEVTFTIASAQFDTQTIVVDAAGEEVAAFEFKPLLAGAELAAANVSFTVTASGTNNKDGVDEAGNAVAGVIAVSLL